MCRAPEKNFPGDKTSQAYRTVTFCVGIVMRFKKIFSVVVLVVSAGILGFWLGEKRLSLSFHNWKPAVVVNQNPLLASGGQADFELFWKVWGRLNDLYVDKSELDPRKMVDGAISGMVAAVGDPYTMFLPVKQNKETKEELGGSFGGVGMELGFKDSKLAVIAPVEDTPAEKAGVKAGDFILRIVDEAKKTDRTTDGMSVQEAVNLIRGDVGTKVKLTMFRQGVDKPYDIELERAVIVVKSVRVEYKNTKDNKKIAWIKLFRFGDRTQGEWNTVVSDIITKKDVKGVIVDLRNNPGGYLEMAVYTAGEFLKMSQTVVIQQYGDGRKIEDQVDRNGRLLKIPVVVLVNGGSASAAEILAGALQDTRRAKIVGEQSFGKGSVQQPEDFPDGSGLHVTVARWLRPNGDWIDKKGITPDVVVKWPENWKDGDPDVQLEKAIEIL